MPEAPTCPYCGTSVQTDLSMHYDKKVDIKCPTCGGVFEVVPGFGPVSKTGVQQPARTQQPWPSTEPSSQPAWQQGPPNPDPFGSQQPSTTYYSGSGYSGPSPWEDPRWTMTKKQSDDFNLGKECLRAFCVMFILVGAALIFIFSTLLFY
jgi:hypothetical protein